MELQDLRIVEFQEIEKLIETEPSNIFRLELLQHYAIDYEDAAWQQFLSGTPATDVVMKDWCSTVAAARKRGVDFVRVRLVVPPVSQYLKFETSWGYRFSASAGEDIRVIESNQINPFESNVPFYMDYWLFGQSRCYLMLYDLVGHYVGVAEVPASEASTYYALSNEAIAKSVPIQDSILVR